MFFSKRLKKFKNIHHCFFSRKGGCSKGIYKGLNCGRGSKDKRKYVLKNLEFVEKKMRVEKNHLILMHQTHSNKVVEIKSKNKRKNIRSDAIITRVKGVALGVVTADCVPILIFDKKKKIAGCIHAGWKGAFSDIIENTISKIKKGNSKSEIFASIGPCIGKKNYEVDLNFYQNFLFKTKKNKKYFYRKNVNKKFFDLRRYVEDKLLKLNVKIDHVNKDTFKEKKFFYSFRRSKKEMQSDYGRCISAICLT